MLELPESHLIFVENDDSTVYSIKDFEQKKIKDLN
jgi:hypothetical protein